MAVWACGRLLEPAALRALHSRHGPTETRRARARRVADRARLDGSPDGRDIRRMNLFVFGLGFTGRRFAERGARPLRHRARHRHRSRRGGAARRGDGLQPCAPSGRRPTIRASPTTSPTPTCSSSRRPPARDGDPVLRALRGRHRGEPDRLDRLPLDHRRLRRPRAAPGSTRRHRPTPAQRPLADRGSPSRAAWLALGARDRQGRAGVPPLRHLRPGPQPDREAARGPVAAHRQGRAGVQPHPRRRHRHDARSPRSTGPRPGAIYNVTDDEPAPPQTVTEHAAALAGLPLPPEVDFETADLSARWRAASTARTSGCGTA